jgi:hypothetical protein
MFDGIDLRLIDAKSIAEEHPDAARCASFSGSATGRSLVSILGFSRGTHAREDYPERDEVRAFPSSGRVY